MTTPPQLTTIDGFPFPVAASPGAEPLARTIAARCERAHSALRMTLDFDPKYTLLVLNETDWPAFAAFPLYAMPHNQRLEPGVHGAVDTTGPNSLIVGANRGSFFDEVSAIVVEDLGDEAIAALRAAYPSEAAPGYDLSAFADMLVIHELGHLFEMQVPVRLPRRWMSEFFANLCLHAAIAAAEPELFVSLRTLPSLVVRTEDKHWPNRTLAKFEELYIGVGAANYVWYQCQLHECAARIHDVMGDDALRRFHTALRGHDLRRTPDHELASFLREHIGEAAAEIVTQWPE